MQRIIVATALLLGMALGLLAVAPTTVSAADLDCKDFGSQAEAQTYFEQGGGSPSYNFNNLDANHNGQACEDFGYSGGGGGGGGDTGTVEQPPVDNSAPVTEDTGTTTDTTTVDTSVGATTDTTTTTTSTTTAATTSLPSTGVGSTTSSSITMTTLLLALFAVAALVVGTAGLVRGRRG
jgi:hypothetical protein